MDEMYCAELKGHNRTVSTRLEDISNLNKNFTSVFTNLTPKFCGTEADHSLPEEHKLATISL
jgi:hypothetical protein